MIIARLYGGLGNQMFQYAAGIALADLRRTVLKLDVSWFGETTGEAAHTRYGLSCFNITEQFATAEEVDQLRYEPAPPDSTIARLRRRLSGASRPEPVPSSRWHLPSTFAFYPTFFDLPDGTYLDGHFQSEQFFQNVAGLIRLQFSYRYDPPPVVAELADVIRKSGPSIALHFRRGDYAKDPRYLQENGVLSFDYYHRAVRWLKEQEPNLKLYIFSDEIDAIEREFRPDAPHRFVREVEAWHSYDTIRLMSLCDHAIIANSTFSWWSAWLNPSTRKVVVAPDRWFSGQTHDGRDVIPTTWHLFPRGG